MKPGIFLLILAIALNYSCSSKKDQLSKVWFYIEGYTASGKALKADKDDSTSKKIVLNPACFVNLETNGTYSAYLFKFDYGTWKIIDNSIVLLNTKKEEKKLPILVFQGKDLMLRIPDLHGDSLHCNFESSSGVFKSEDENPFSAINNQWRITPTHKETDDEITSRLLNHFKFWEKYFAWGLKTEQTTLDVRSTPTPLKIYGNGFTLKNFDLLPGAWQKCFYDEDDCRRANEKLETFIRTNDIAWPHTESKYKMFLSAFQQMQQIMK